MAADGSFDPGNSPGGDSGRNSIYFNEMYGTWNAGPNEPGKRRFTPPPGFPPPHNTSSEGISSTFWYEFWETPFFEDYRNSRTDGQGYTEPGVVRFASQVYRPLDAFENNGLDMYCVSAYDASNMPAKYRIPNNRERPFTTLDVPADQPSDRIPWRRSNNGNPVNTWGQAPYLPGTFAEPWDTNSATQSMTPPFDVERCMKYVGTFSQAPDPDALPNPLGMTRKIIEDGGGAIPVILHVLDSLKVPYVVKSGFRSTFKPFELNRFIRPPWFYGPHFRTIGPNPEDGSRRQGAPPITPVGFTGEFIVSVDDGHLIRSQEHGKFNAVDVAGPGGTRAELEAILKALRAYPEIFQTVYVGEFYLAWQVMDEPHQVAHETTGMLRARNFHATTGRHERAALIISGGRRVEHSPLYVSDTEVQVEPGPSDSMSKVHRLDYAASRQIFGAGGDVSSFPFEGPCVQSDRIHIASTPTLIRDAMRDHLLEQQIASGTVFNKPITKPGNSAARPTPGMAYPPILTTDLPIRDFSGSLNNVYSFGGTGTNFTLSVTRLPRGFREKDYADGLAVMFRLKYPSGAHETRDRFQFGFHKPAADVKGYSQGWTVLDSPDAGPTYTGVMGAQRRGEWVYGIAGQTFQGGQRRTQFVDRMNSFKIRERRQHDDATYYEGLGGAASGATTDSFMMHRNMELFVSDHAEPELYYLSGFSIGKTTDRNGLPMAYHWVQEDQRGFGGGDTSLPFYPYHRFKYEFWHTWQDLDRGPANTQYPALVFPWRCGDYLPPEAWFFVPEKTQSNTYTGRLKIYRSTYGPNQWSSDYGPLRLTSRWLPSDPRLKVNGGTVDAQPGDYLRNYTVGDTKADRNPTMSAYNGQWYQDKHLVGVVGPFRGAIWSDKRDSPNGSGRVFKVVRDPRRKDRLHLAMFQTSSVFAQPGSWDGVWFAQSQDDGRTWGRARQMNPFVEDRPPHWSATHEGGSPSLAITTGGDLLGLARATFKGEAQQSLLNINYAGGGIVTDYEREQVVFRQGSGGN